MALGTTRQAERLRSSLSDLTALAMRDLRASVSGFEGAEAVRDGLAETLPRIVALYGSAAGAVAADWYDDYRSELGVSRRFSAIVAEMPDLGTDALAGWAVEPLFSDQPDRATALVRAEGGAQRRILNMSRSTIAVSSIADPSATGWQRVGSGECAFCAMLIGRGSVYQEATADFASHDHCRCSAIPAFDGLPRPVRSYAPTRRDITPADRARVREYLRTH